MASDFWKVGHKPTLFAAFLYFDLAFMVWVILGPLGVQIASTLALTAAQKGLMVATPVLFGALLRVPMGLLADRLTPKRAGLIGQVVVLLALLVAWIFGIHSFHQVLILGGVLGMAGAS
ncbi:MAG: MFS transporter, partial [Pseudomonadota bacterium]|nr:MFS transporter [Pseudomonadota bacterium]